MFPLCEGQVEWYADLERSGRGLNQVFAWRQTQIRMEHLQNMSLAQSVTATLTYSMITF
jgi:hypothetical protein